MKTFFNLDNPIEQIKRNFITDFTIEQIDIYPYDKAIITILLYENENVILPKRLIMSGDDYNKWGTSDDYLINWINEQIKNINF